MNRTWLLSLLLVPAVAHADYPKPVARHISDYANILTPDDAKDITEFFNDLEHKTGMQATVVTVNSMAEYGTNDVSVEKFTNSLFNRWGLGRKNVNDGLMILLSVRDRKARIELGSAYGFHYDAAMQNVMNTAMVPRFKAGEYSMGLRAGAHAAIAALSNPPAEGQTNAFQQSWQNLPAAAREPRRHQEQGGGIPRLYLYIGIGVVVLLIVMVMSQSTGGTGSNLMLVALGALLGGLVTTLMSGGGGGRRGRDDDDDSGGSSSSGGSSDSSSSSDDSTDYGGGSSEGGGATGSW